MVNISKLYSQLSIDPWRKQNGFTPDFEHLQNQLLQGPASERETVVSSFLQRHQPCLFGRIAAKLGLITYCILDEHDLTSNDEAIQKKIQAARTEWTRLAYEGRRSAFVIMACSEKLALALPDTGLLQLALRLCSLYLLQVTEPNKIYTEEIFLEIPGSRRMTWRWNVGVNFFGAAGDGRWWHDHRIPGGIAFSMNSVGHLVKSGQIATKMDELSKLLDVSSEGIIPSKIDSLPKALEIAMRTIEMATNTLSGKATYLLDAPSEYNENVPRCPIQLPQFLRGKNHCEYEGYYHTDESIPSEYFNPSVARESVIVPRRLDFTYLFHDDIDNPDFVTTGAGRRIRELGAGKPPMSSKLSKSTGVIIETNSADRLRRLLNQL